MNWLAIHRLLFSSFFRRRLLVFGLVALTATGQLFNGARPAAASGPFLDGDILPGSLGLFPPPPLLNIYDLTATISGTPVPLDQGGLYAATDDQEASLMRFEDQAVANVLALHNLPTTDALAVRSWGRTEALAQMYELLMAAIDEDNRSADQQNAVDWLGAIAKRQAIASAEAAGWEYVKWAGLSNEGFLRLIADKTTTQAQFETFLSRSPQNYNNPNIDLADAGYCLYHAPDPYGSEYGGRLDPTCFAPCSSVLGCNPPTPTYDQFVKYGQTISAYGALNSTQFAQQAKSIGTAVGIGMATGAAIAAGAVLPAVMVSAPTLAAAVATAIASAAEEGVVLTSTLLFPFSGVLSAAAAAAAVGGIVIVALTIAVVQGITVVSAAKLPGQLAGLIADARSKDQDPKTLKASANGSTSLFSIFVGASLPEPRIETCDNDLTAVPPGIEVGGTSPVLFLGQAPCLNPTLPHQGSPNDPKFLVQEQNAALPKVSQTLEWRDPSNGAASTATFTNNWFVIDANLRTTQSLTIKYTDWNGNLQNAWLLENADGDYSFVKYSIPSSGTADLTNAGSDTIKYVGSDGKKYSAKVKKQATPTGTPKVISSAVEGSPVDFDANDFKPGDAVDPVTYSWRFESESCHTMTPGFTCLVVNGRGLSFGAPVAGAKVSHTWAISGALVAEVTATDAIGATATTTINVLVGNLPPDFSPITSNAAGGPVKVDKDVTVDTDFEDPGGLSTLQADIDWGDGSPEKSKCIAAVTGCPFEIIVIDPSLPPPPPPEPSSIVLTKNPAGSAMDYHLNAKHTYAPGTYTMKVTIWDQSGAQLTRSLQVKVEKYTQSVVFGQPQGATYGDQPVTVTADMSQTGGASFAVSGDPSVCSISGQHPGIIIQTWVADVDILGAGTCEITANTPGNNLYEPGTATQSFSVAKAGLTVTAPEQSATFGESVPALQPSYAGFVNGDDPSDVDTAPTCAAVGFGGDAGTYDITCSGGADANYAMTYVAGTLSVAKAASPLAISGMGLTSVTGQPIQVRASIVHKIGGPPHTGTVTFMEGTAVVSGCENLPLPTNTMVATCESSALGVGGHAITAVYSGDANHVASTSGAVQWTVNKASTDTQGASSGPSIRGKTAATFTATVGVVAPGAGSPSGTVSFFDGRTRLGSGELAAVDGKLVATITATGLALGKHSITAKYAGDGNFTASASPAFVHYVNTSLAKYPKLPTGAPNLAGANLRGAFLVGVNLARADLTEANIGNATLISTNLTGATLNQVTATSANFASAQMTNLVIRGGNYKSATFTGTDLTGTTFNGVNLKGAKDMAKATLDGVTWVKTLCPDGTQSASHGDTCLGHLN